MFYHHQDELAVLTTFKFSSFSLLSYFAPSSLTSRSIENNSCFAYVQVQPVFRTSEVGTLLIPCFAKSGQMYIYRRQRSSSLYSCQCGSMEYQVRCYLPLA